MSLKGPPPQSSPMGASLLMELHLKEISKPKTHPILLETNRGSWEGEQWPEHTVVETNAWCEDAIPPPSQPRLTSDIIHRTRHTLALSVNGPHCPSATVLQEGTIN